jgi:pyruvate formate lyase activating enzyme
VIVEKILNSPTVKKALLYTRVDDSVQCNTCERRCIIPVGSCGWCGTRINIDGELYTIVYGDISGLESRPIEIKPFYHYWPGSTSLTFSTWSCNFNCPWCQNSSLSRAKPNIKYVNYVEPYEMVDIALKYGDEGLCVSFNEPTMLFEYSIDVFRIGSRRGLYCCYVSNGYMTIEALRMLAESGLTGIKIDVKGDKEVYRNYIGGCDVDIVWRNIREARSMGLHVEVVNLIVTDVNDDEACIREIVERHMKEAGPETPIHFTRYFPAYRFHNPPTKIETLEKAYRIAKEAGVYYPYIGNVPGNPYENTYCPNCNYTLIKRYGYRIVKYEVIDNKCPKCGFKIHIAGKYIRK